MYSYLTNNKYNNIEYLQCQSASITHGDLVIVINQKILGAEKHLGIIEFILVLTEVFPNCNILELNADTIYFLIALKY